MRTSLHDQLSALAADIECHPARGAEARDALAWAQARVAELAAQADEAERATRVLRFGDRFSFDPARYAAN